MSHTWFLGREESKTFRKNSGKITLQKENVRFKPISQIWYFQIMLSIQGRYLGWLQRFFNILLEAILFPKEGKLEPPQGWVDGSKHIDFHKEWASTIIRNSSGRLCPNALLLHPDILSQSKCVLLRRRRHSQHLTQCLVFIDHLFLTCWIPCQYPLNGAHCRFVVIFSLHFQLSLPPVLGGGGTILSLNHLIATTFHLARKESLKLILGFGTKCNRTESCH